MADTHNKPRIAVVGVIDGWSSEALADAVEEATGFRLLVDMAKVTVDLASGKAMYGDVDLCSLDALIVKKLGSAYSPQLLDRIAVLEYIERAGVRVFSRPGTIGSLLNRLSCTMALSSAGIPMPATVVTEDIEAAEEAARRFGHTVLKPLYSTKARGMLMLEPGDPELRAKLEAYQADGNDVFYLQQRVDIPGRDLGVVFLGGKYMGTYARVGSENSWNTTILAGGKYAPHEPTAEALDIATKAQAVFDLAFTSVDVVETATGPIVFEVSAFGGFRGCKDGLGLDAASLYTEYVLGELSK